MNMLELEIGIDIDLILCYRYGRKCWKRKAR